MSKKAGIMQVYRVLQKYSDDKNLLTQQDIIRHIKEDYDEELERKSVADSIRILTDELDVDIIKEKNGCYYNDRLLEVSEINYLTDAVFSSKGITGKYSKDLCEKLLSTLSVNYRKNIKHLYKAEDIDRSKNKDFFMTIDEITHCIRHNKQISFKYLTYDENLNPIPKKHKGNDTYVVSPICMAYSRGLCYLLTIARYPGETLKDITPFRIDYIVDAQRCDNLKREKVEEALPKYKNGFSITDYINHHIYMFGSDNIINITLKAKNLDAYKYIKEWFGNASKSYKNNKGETIIEVRTDENTFFYWIMQYSQHFILLGPKSLVNKTRKAAQDILDTYK